jgi:hypothetical protein
MTAGIMKPMQSMSISLHNCDHQEPFVVGQELLNETPELGNYLSLRIERGDHTIYFHDMTLAVLIGLANQLSTAVEMVDCSKLSESRIGLPAFRENQTSGASEFLANVGLPPEVKHG